VSYRVCTSCLEASGPSTNSPQPSILTVYWLPGPGSLLHRCFSTLSSYNLSKSFIVEFLCSRTFMNVCHAYDTLLQDEQRRTLSSSPSFKTSVVPNQTHSVVSYMHLIYVFLHIKVVWIVLQICPLFILGLWLSKANPSVCGSLEAYDVKDKVNRTSGWARIAAASRRGQPAERANATRLRHMTGSIQSSAICLARITTSSSRRFELRNFAGGMWSIV
jgi:hypothetical protein